ncbi:omega-hydroxypalmitate O-feruloyl transferase-like [Papaver somniferum]|uniref:omega-hydroxypalmitate O-feruloyl transferase-like n=1 Tax=Papaver somniferum TaxID=3469 RepID=UPI000E6FF323|nr:omega-hydroxypalmitate O-feruloyl transferase-like [Papaver somniferum]
MVPPAEETPKDLYFLSNFDTMNMNMLNTIYCFNKPFDVGRLDPAEAIRDGEGALFVEAEANITLDEIGDFSTPDPDTYEKLVYILDQKNILQNPLYLAQWNGVSEWGEVTRGLPLTNPPFLDRTLLKARNPPKVEFTHGHEDIVDISNTKATFEQEMLIYKSFVFDPEILQQLKKKAMGDGVLKRCTSFEVLTALMWRVRTQSLRLHPDQQVRLYFPVDARSILDPKLPKDYFGNAITNMSCQCSASEMLDSPLSSTIEKIQRSIKMVTDDYVKSTIDFLEDPKSFQHHSSTTYLSSWSSLRLSSIDFGWGEPFFAGPTKLTLVIENPTKLIVVVWVLFLSHGKDNKGINLILGLPASSMKIFEALIEMQTKFKKPLSARL